jgi:N-acetyl sugar amidotransferase
MDTSDPEIVFDDTGICNHCHNYDRGVSNAPFSNPKKAELLDRLVREITLSVPSYNKYDCIIGMSGGVDSSYVAYKVKELGLKPIAFHLDNEYNDPISVRNIRALVSKLSIDLITVNVDWEEYSDLQRSFLYASVPDIEIPTDYALNTVFHQLADQYHVKYLINGCNIRTESHLPRQWSQGHFDLRYVESVHERYGKVPLVNYPKMSLTDQLRYKATHNVVSLLNYLDYNKKSAMKEMIEKFGWEYYGGKHYESIFTRFYQGYILPKKFGFDKRKMHFSSLICSGEMTREDALVELAQEPYPVALQESDKEFVCSKLGISEKQFAEIMSTPRRHFEDFDSVTNSLPVKSARMIRDGLIRPFIA